MAALSNLHSTGKHWQNIAPTEAARNATLADRVSGYGVWIYLQSHPQAKIYQFALEDAIYYAPRPIWGEVFGPWRYRDYANLPTGQLFQKLRNEGFTALVIHTGRLPDLTARADFERYFRRLHRDGQVALYALSPTVAATAVHPLP